jgi:hypothetical protein
MTVRIPYSELEIDHRKLAAILTPALLSPTRDDAGEAKARRAGIGWLYWSEAHYRACTYLN